MWDRILNSISSNAVQMDLRPKPQASLDQNRYG